MCLVQRLQCTGVLARPSRLFRYPLRTHDAEADSAHDQVPLRSVYTWQDEVRPEKWTLMVGLLAALSVVPPLSYNRNEIANIKGDSVCINVAYNGKPASCD